MASGSPMSFWIKFFSEASIPAGVAANYAVTFTENRIQEDMLMELTKEYLSDMGITTLGDIIAILRHAKKVHTQTARDKALQSNASFGRNSPTIKSVKPSTPASRTLSHFIRKDAAPQPMEVERVPSPKISAELANRLGTGVKDSPKVSFLSLGRKAKEEVPVPKVRRVTPEMEGAYKVTMPKGTTAKTKKILQQQQQQQGSSSVFKRLGVATSEEKDSPAKSFTVTGLGKVVMTNPTGSSSASVFNRLGNQLTVKRAASSTCPDSEDSEEDSIALAYAGVLKDSPVPQKQVQLTKKKSIIAQRKKLMQKAKAAQTSEVSTSSEGIMSHEYERVSALNRLGRGSTTTTTESSGISSALSRLGKQGSTAISTDCDFTITRAVGQKVSVQKKASVSSSQESTKKYNLRTSSEKTVTGAKKTGVFNRLGKQT